MGVYYDNKRGQGVMMFTRGTIVAQRVVSDQYHLLTIEQPDIATQARPGQFIMLKAWERIDLLLPRPFSLYRILPERGQLQILYQVRGQGTAEIARRVPGEKVELTGPAGNGIVLPEEGAIALLGRGIGAAPLMAIAETAAARKGLAVYTFLSARKTELLLGRDDFSRYASRVTLATDDGHHNEGRLLTALLAEMIAREGIAIRSVYTCGSRRLARGLLPMQARYGFTAYIFLEETMACGIGSCKGCVCKVREPGSPAGFVYKKVCQDGPVFPVDKVVW
jgi:dihydroorotate dehydrogenase electron transfer subunit